MKHAGLCGQEKIVWSTNKVIDFDFDNLSQDVRSVTNPNIMSS